MTTPILHSEDDRQLVFEAPRMGSTIFGSLAALVLLLVWALFPGYRIAQGVLLVMAVVGFSGRLQIHRLVLDLTSRRWTYRDGWVWQGPVGEGTFDDLGCVAIERNELQNGLVTSKLRSRLLYLEFTTFVEKYEACFPLGFAMGPNVAPDKAREYADKLGVNVVDRTTELASDSPPEPESDHPETPPDA